MPDFIAGIYSVSLIGTWGEIAVRVALSRPKNFKCAPLELKRIAARSAVLKLLFPVCR